MQTAHVELIDSKVLEPRLSNEQPPHKDLSEGERPKGNGSESQGANRLGADRDRRRFLSNEF